MLDKVDIEIVKTEIARRGYVYNSHYYKYGRILWINATCPNKHQPKDRKWNSFQLGHGCRICGPAQLNIEFVKITILDRGFIYNFHFYKKKQLYINATCPEDHPPRDRQWSSFYRGVGCMDCYTLKQTKYTLETRKLVRSLRNAQTRALKAVRKPRTGSLTELALNLLGCLPEEAVKWIESKWLPGMNWENHGKWHMDHIEPLSSFDFNKKEDLLKAFHYTNLQPLWAVDNLIKGPHR